MSTRDDIIRRVKEIPVLPFAVVKALDLAEDPRASLIDLQKAIEVDPGLTSHVLRVANSAYYRGNHEVLSVRDALVRLGTRIVSQWILAMSMAPLARQPIAGYDMAPSDLLRHSVAVAAGVDILARQLGFTPPPQGFASGLLHDLGKIVLGTFMEADAGKVATKAFAEGMSFEMAEREALGVDHAEAGFFLMESWRIPESISTVVLYHHRPDEYTGSGHVCVDLVHVVDIICSLEGIASGVDASHYVPSGGALKRLGMTNAAAELLMSSLSESLDGLFKMVDG